MRLQILDEYLIERPVLIEINIKKDISGLNNIVCSDSVLQDLIMYLSQNKYLTVTLKDE